MPFCLGIFGNIRHLGPVEALSSGSERCKVLPVDGSGKIDGLGLAAVQGFEWNHQETEYA